MPAPARVRYFAVALVVSCCVSLAAGGCRKHPAPATAAAAPAESVANPAEKSWPLTGAVVAANPDRGTLTVTHDPIEGFMPAMTMEFKVAAADLAAARPGARIRGRMIQADTDFYLEDIWPDEAGARRAVEDAAKMLAQETRILGNSAFREVGEAAPEFALFDQEGRVVPANAFRGKRVVLNFIFTRCPVPTMCPAATLKMQALQRAAREAGVANFELVSISLDPTYDRPAVLKAYATERGIDVSNFHFLTGPELAVKNLLAQCGVVAEPGEGILKHSLATLLIDEHGKIVHREDGSRWEIDAFLGRLK